MKFEQINEIKDKYLGYIVVFEGHQGYGAFAEDAEALKHVIYSELGTYKDVQYASQKDLKQIEQKLEQKTVSYVLINRNGDMMKQVSYGDNGYYRMLHKDHPEKLKDIMPSSILYDEKRYEEYVTLFLGKSYYGAQELDAEVLLKAIDSDVIHPIIHPSKTFAYCERLEKLEDGLRDKRISYVILGKEGTTVFKEVLFPDNQYSTYIDGESDEGYEEESSDTSDIEALEPENNEYIISISADEGYEEQSPDTPDIDELESETDEAYEGYEEESSDMPDIEELVPVTDEDVIAISSVRNIYFTPKFRRYYEKADRNVRANINEIIDKFTSLEGDELSEYLKRSCNKKLVGVKYNFDKLYVDHSSGHRLIWCHADTIVEDESSDSIAIIAYVDDHEKQGLEGNNTDISDLELAIRETDKLCEEMVYDEYSNSIPPYLFYKDRFVPKLNGNQKQYLDMDPPLMLQGCAGSGKTQVSLEIFAKLINDNKKPVYVTYTPELVDDVKDKAESLPELESRSIKSLIMTIEELFIQALGMNKRDLSLVNLKTFRDWKNTRYIHKRDNKYKAIDDEVAWTYIRGIIKGGSADGSVSVLSRKEFEDWATGKENMELEQANRIYDIHEEFEKYISENDMYDDNMLAKMVLEKVEAKNSVGILIADEIQDLTYIQIRALIHIVKDYQIYLCGDINQRINPSVIDLNSVEALFYQNGKSALNTQRLGSSFRSGKSLVDFINHLSSLRRKYIALQDSNSEVKEISLRDDGDGFWATICNEKSPEMNLKSVCEIAIDAANCIVIVPDEDVRNRLAAGNSKLFERVRTVREMKGLEYDNVIIYDFISYKIDFFEEIIQGKRRKDTFGRLMFNMLYVACTRAKDRLIICESNCSDEIKNIVYKDITTKDSLINVKGFMSLENDPEGWFREAQRLEQMRQFNKAIHAYNNIRGEDHQKEIKRCMLMDEMIKLDKDADIDDLKERLDEIGNELIDLEEYKYASDVYEVLKRTCGIITINSIFAEAKCGRISSMDDVRSAFDNCSNLDNEAWKFNEYLKLRNAQNRKTINNIRTIAEGIIDGR